MEDLFGNKVDSQVFTLRTKSGTLKFNPCVTVLGAGPAEFRCKHCQHLYVKEYAGRYFKCSLRDKGGKSGGPAMDHRANWPTCAKFEKEDKP